MGDYKTLSRRFCFLTILLVSSLYSQEHELPKSWRSWGNIETCHPKAILFPERLEDIYDIIKKAQQEKATIRFVGSGHAPLDLTCTDGYIVTTDYFNKIIKIIEIDPETHYVIVECGIKIKDLIEQLAEYNLALPNQGLITEQSIAGALATGTHGSGNLAQLSDFVVSIELIDGTGVLHTFTKAETPRELAAACLNLGSLGFIYRITLACVSAFTVEHARLLNTWPAVLSSYKELCSRYDHVMLMGHPYSDAVLVHTWKRVDQEPNGSATDRFIRTILMSDLTSLIGFYCATYAPTITNSLLEWYLYFFQQAAHTDHGYKSLSLGTPREPSHYFEGEIALPFDSFPEVIKIIQNLYNLYKQEGTEPVGLLFCRFAKASTSSLLSPSYDQDVAYISFFEMGDSVTYKAFYEAIQQRLLSYQGKPHWGKYHTLNQEELVKAHGERFEKFNALRRQLDPHDIFANEHIKKIFSFNKTRTNYN